MQVRRKVTIKVDERKAEFDTLFDPGSTITLTSYKALEELLGEVPLKKLARVRWIILANGKKIEVDAYVDAEVTIDKYMIEERIYLSKERMREAIIEGKTTKLPDLVIGAPTMESWGIELDLKRGEVKSCREGFMLI